MPSALPPSFRLLQEVEDGRTYFPSPVTPSPRTYRGKPARITIQPGRARARARKPSSPLGALQANFGRAQLQFAAPDAVLVCVRRKRRKQVLHAKRIAGRSGLRKPRRNFWSSVSCRT